MSNGESTRSARGQTLVMVALGMVALVGMVGVVIDVGLQWADNRGAQNGTDATAHAGTVVIMRHLSSHPASLLKDVDVRDAVENMATRVGMTLEDAEYVGYEPDPATGELEPVPLSIEVGYGGDIPPDARGVRVVGTRIHETLFARVVGITELTVHTDGIAVTGLAAEPCPPGEKCAFLPITVPNTAVTCNGQNKAVPTEESWPLGVEIIIPLCGTGPGSVGWIDWTPPAGGDSELAGEICDPDPPEITLPNWFYVNSPGNTNSGPVQTCLEKWIDKVILIPLFDDMCRINPGEPNPCPEGEDPAGQNSWYHFPSYATLYLTGVYIQGNHAATCDTGNGATSCLTGRFVDTSGAGTVGQWVPPDPNDPPVSQRFVVQLVR